MKKLSFAFLSLFFFSSAIAQTKYSISGVVRDKKETIPGAAIYVSGYKMATVSDNDGKFVLPNLPAGNYDILVQLMGYQPYSKNVIISDKSVEIDVTLTENTTQLKEVVISSNENRAYYIDLFRRYFIGETPNAQQCKILNTDVLLIDFDKKNQLVEISATDFLIIENQALGYRIKYLLKSFEYNYRTKILFFSGHSVFEEMAGSNTKQRRWEKNRMIAYNGSIQHFYKSLYKKTLAEEGFLLYKQVMVKNPKKLPDSLINANVRKLATGPNGITNLITFREGSNDSLSYWLKQRREPAQFAVVNRTPILLDTLTKKVNEDLKEMNFQDALYIVYTKELETPAYGFTSFKINRTPDLKTYQISLLEKMDGPIGFYSNGAVDNPRSSLYSGHMAYEKVADLLPIDYIPIYKK